ncbi:putative protein kinase RLK-Pelle-LRR-XII-1 family [Helianthus debilis subsp. tardiflorus]
MVFNLVLTKKLNTKQPIVFLSPSSPVHFLFYVLFIFLTPTTISFCYGGRNETDHHALLKIKSMITQDPYGALISWNNSFHFYDWTGVTCGKRQKRVTRLALDSQGLEGSLSPHVGNLSFLRELCLHNNSFQGAIPHELGHLSRIRILYLQYNEFDGAIPPNISGCLDLEVLYLSHNKLVGSIPKEMSFLSKLTIVKLGSNNLTGGISPFLGNITSIEVFSVPRNPLGGNIPDAIGHWKSLKEIYLGACNLSGIIPYSIYNLSLLASLPDNQLTGSLPPGIGVVLPHLAILQLWDNQLTGPLPPSISNCSRLQMISIARNKFSGKLTIDFAKLRDISVINLGGNNFGSKEADEMKFIDSLKNCTSLEILSLNYCNFQGVLPISIGNLSDQLYCISLGRIPSSLGKCHRLLEVYLNNNKLNGNIPTQLLQVSSLSVKLDLSQNNLFGSLPTEVGDLKMLSDLDLYDNNISGSIPSSLGGCASLSRLSLKGNLFQGTIPLSLSSLKGLVELDISQNNLSGQIPRFLERFLLKKLNLSYNDFEGVVPMLGVFGNASAFPVFGNSRLCGGFVELRLPKCNEMKRHKKTNLNGNGGFSSVYKGTLGEGDNRFVAVKVLHLQNRGAQRSFTRECEACRNIRHRNLLKIITSCSSVDYQGNDFKALVYEFMPNGSLHDWLHSSERTSRLNLLQIANILLDVASALDYIHNHCIPAIVHGDLKPSNILLEDDMVAHVGDFGLARFLGTTSNQNSSSGIKGTIGYAPPEYGLWSEMTSSGDVYSFGILILEAMTQKKPTDDIFNESLSLHKFASLALLDHVTDVIDVKILNACQEEETFMQNQEENTKKIEELLASIVKIGVSCSMDSPQQRMNIKKCCARIAPYFRCTS